MITGNLNAHPNSPCDVVETLSAQVERSAPGKLALRFRIDGDIGQLSIPAGGASSRRDELWRHTCFELFLKAGASAAYYEFNFAPSGDWAAYRFDGYRSGMSNAEMPAAPTISSRSSAGRFELAVDLSLPSDVTSGDALSLTAVIEDRTQRISYWAVAHAPLKPDFHHDDGFVLRLPA